MTADSHIAADRLALLRTEIDTLDDQLVELLGRRMEYGRAIGDIKAELGLEPYQLDRQSEVLRRVRLLASRHGLDPAYIADVFHKIVTETVRAEQRRLPAGARPADVRYPDRGSLT